jgi:hypothetical protein
MSSHLTDRERRAGRAELLARAIEAFAARQALAIHQFGSLARGDGDALSDLDLWITVPDERLPGVDRQRAGTYRRVADVLIRHEAAQNSPLGGRYSLVIHRTATGLYHIDYYLAPRSTSVILPEARALYGDDSLPRGSWQLNVPASAATSVAERVAFLPCLAFIGVKKVRRRDAAFMGFLAAEYRRFIAQYHLPLEAIGDAPRLATIERLLRQVARVADRRQRRAIEEIVQRYLPLGAGPKRR